MYGLQILIQETLEHPFYVDGKGTGLNMNVVTRQLPSATNIHWTKKWYEVWKTAIKVVD